MRRRRSPQIDASTSKEALKDRAYVNAESADEGSCQVSFASNIKRNKVVEVEEEVREVVETLPNDSSYRSQPPYAEQDPRNPKPCLQPPTD